MKKTLKSVPKYGDHGGGDVRLLQMALHEAGFSVGEFDDWFGDKTLAALKKFQKSKGMPGSGVIPIDGGKTFSLLNLVLAPPQEDEIIEKPNASDNYFGAPQVGANIDLLGKHETDPALNERYVPEWKKEGLPGYKTLSGNRYAWCSNKVNADLRKVGLKGTDSAAAASHSKWGKACPFWFGCTLPIKHKSGGRHVAFFLYWIDEAKKIAAVYGGNQGNRMSIVAVNLAGKGDTLVPGPRWSKELPDGQIVSMRQVLDKYPFLKVGSSRTNSSTR